MFLDVGLRDGAFCKEISNMNLKFDIVAKKSEFLSLFFHIFRSLLITINIFASSCNIILKNRLNVPLTFYSPKAKLENGIIATKM